MIQSIVFRFGDSMPAGVVEKWKNELDLLTGKSRQEAGLPGASRQNAGVPGKQAVELRRRIEAYLDAGHGKCWLNRPDIARLVERALFHFDGQRYLLLAWCIMPNHVHVLFQLFPGVELESVLHSWKSFTAKKVNCLLGLEGTFWQREYYDHLVRNDDDFERVIRYIAENSAKGGLKNWPWVWIQP